MILQRNIAHVRSVYREYPRQFWVLTGATFVNRLGGALLFPFFTLYLTRRFGIGMTEVGVLFALWAGTSFIGSIVGGALTDKLGRKGVMILSLVASGLGSLAMGLAGSMVLFALIAMASGLLEEAGGPAHSAMVADLLPPEKRAEGFGILRVAFNLAVVVGPAIGGLLAAQSYMLLFALDATASTVTAVIVALALAETKPPAEEGDAVGMVDTIKGYGDVAKDMLFMAFVGISALMVMVYIQMNTTLAVFLRDVHGVQEQGFGLILSLNAAMVVLFQLSITRWVKSYRPLYVLAVGALLYAVGFSMYGFTATFGLFLLAMVIITMGEMFVVPVSDAIVADMAPEQMRGRYMAAFGLSWGISVGLGPLLAGIIMDNYDPHWVWYLSGIVSVVTAIGFLLLYRVQQGRQEGREDEPPSPLPVEGVVGQG
jgi:MFS family permease